MTVAADGGVLVSNRLSKTDRDVLGLDVPLRVPR